MGGCMGAPPGGLDAEDMAELEAMGEGCAKGISGGLPAAFCTPRGLAAIPGASSGGSPIPAGSLPGATGLPTMPGVGDPGIGGLLGMPSMGGFPAIGVPGGMPAMGLQGLPAMGGAIGGMPAVGQVPPPPQEQHAALEDKRTASREEVDRFASTNRLDDSAAALFKKEPADIQANVIDRGSLAECKNPSAALMGRLRDARQNRFKPVGGNRAAGSGVTLGVGAAATCKEVEEFIAENKIDMGAARALRAEPPDIQQGVMDRGTLDGFQNPSALVMARIKDVKKVRQEASTHTNNPTTGELTGSGGSSGQATRVLTRAELRAVVEARKAGKGGGAISMAAIMQKRKASRSRSRRGRGRSRSRSRRRSRSRGRSQSRGRRR